MSMLMFSRHPSADQVVTDNADDALPVKMNTLLVGELQQFNRLAGGPVVQYAVVTSDATGLNVAAGPAIYYGLICTTAGATGCVVYDGLTATGTVLRPLAAGVAGTFYGTGLGILCNNGITVDWTDGTWLVLYVPTT